jgi:hypothetical protein
VDLKEQIRRAFADVPYPGDDGLTSHRPCKECEGVAQVLQGRAWTSLSAVDVCDVGDALPLLTPSAFQHYLPAFLIGCIVDRDAVDIAWTSVMLGLRPNSQKDFEARAGLFSKAQADAVAAFLEWQDGIEREEHLSMRIPRRDETRFAKAIAYWKARGGAARS